MRALNGGEGGRVQFEKIIPQGGKMSLEGALTSYTSEEDLSSSWVRGLIDPNSPRLMTDACRSDQRVFARQRWPSESCDRSRRVFREPHGECAITGREHPLGDGRVSCRVCTPILLRCSPLDNPAWPSCFPAVWIAR
jgi:hypothetical protein